MKKAKYYLIITFLILASCNQMEKINDEINQQTRVYSNQIEYTLIDADYATIGSLAKSIDSADGVFISSKKYFNDSIQAATYIPAFIGKKYPALSTGSSAMITYNYNGALPEGYLPYTTAVNDTLKSSDYVSIDGVLQASAYFSPGYAPEVYIPGILARKVSSPAVGALRLVTYKYSTVDPVVDFAHIADITIAREDFNGSLGTYTPLSIAGAQVWTAASYGGDQYAKISGYSGGNQINDDWLVSGPINLSGVSNASLNFREAAKYVNTKWYQLRALVSSNWDGTQAGITTAAWDTLSGYTFPTGADYVFVESGKISLSAYANKTINVALRYLSTTTNAATWEIDWAAVVKPGTQPPVIGLTPDTYSAYYTYTSNGWGKADNIYYLNAADYNAMGSPGTNDYFSTSISPQNYLPALLNTKYPMAGEGYQVTLVYKFYSGSLLTLADNYTFKNGAWTSAYDYVQPKSSQFLYSTSGWVFDPTVTITMAAADYQIIVDWVKANKGPSFVDTYGTQEFYTGAGSYYKNFDLRTGKWDTSVFSTWQDAVASAIGNVLLPAKYPNAVSQVSGIDVFYIVNFITYDGANGMYAIKFQCTRSGPDPQFTLVEGPY